MNPESRGIDLRLRVKGGFAASRARRLRTSPAEDCAELPELPVKGGLLGDALPAKSLSTYRLER
ncbi:MAG TPA: hypothetical protein VMT52_16690 [Planctomycetota bacterium]|nr:hypothetical protein [Planctomycetota bacterium]